MKKRIMATIMALILSFSVLTGCGGSSKNDYLSDISEIAEFSQGFENISDDPAEMVGAVEKLLKDLNVKTPEGIAVKDDYQEMADILNTMLKNQDDADALMSALSDLTKIYEKIEDDAEKFVDAAEKAGVDDDDIKDLGFDF